VKHWEEYSAARNEMLTKTHTMVAPWTIVRAGDKPAARINLIRDLLTRSEFRGRIAKPICLIPKLSSAFTRTPSAAGR
jgi:hypothetical protein